MKPTQILAKLCKDGKIDGPSYSNGKVKIGRQTFFLQAEDSDCNLNTKGEPNISFFILVIIFQFSDYNFAYLLLEMKSYCLFFFTFLQLLLLICQGSSLCCDISTCRSGGAHGTSCSSSMA